MRSNRSFASLAVEVDLGHDPLAAGSGMAVGAPVPVLDPPPVGIGPVFMSRTTSGRRMVPQSPNEALQPEAPPPPPPRPPGRKRPTLSAISGFLSFLVIVALGALGGLVWGTNRLRAPGPLEADRIVFIAPHTDLPDIIEKLSADDVIDSPLALNIVLTVERKRGRVRAGEYLFKQHASMRSVVDTLVNGKQILHAITIPEGLTSAQVVQRLRDSDVLVGDIREIPKEGTLLPETYKVARGSSRNDVLQKMEDDERRALEQIWARRSPDLPLRSPFDLVTLASIVEKETGKADERPRVAGVFINRLQKHMRLQSDPTIVYGLVAGQGTLGHSITRAELDRRTPYNTYQIDNLPPGAIDNPGRAALEAVANPSRTSDLYFVADGTGGHVFAASLDEHSRNVQRWRQIERDAKDKVDVDKLSPAAIAPTTSPLPSPTRTNQRSDASDVIFGTLPKTIDTTSLGQVASFANPATNHDIASIASVEESLPPPRRGQKGTSTVNIAALSTSIDALGFTIGGAEAQLPIALDGPVTPDTVDQPMAQGAGGPVRTARLSLDALPGQTGGDLFNDTGPAVPATPIKAPPLHPKIYDVSEGTALDPLHDKTYDLNTAKTIPPDLIH